MRKKQYFRSGLTAFATLLSFTPAFVSAQEVIESVSETEMLVFTSFSRNGRLSTRLENAWQRLEKETQGIEKDYNDFKKLLSKEYGVQYSLDVSLLSQKGGPNGGKTATQTIYAPTVSWNIFNDETYGSGTINASYTAVRYWGNKGQNISNSLFVANQINDFPSETNSIDELSYTQTLFDNKFSITVGQFPIYDFDGTEYDSNQQVNFVNYALSQNGTSTYAVAGLGAYFEYTPVEELSFAAGLQNARNISGQTLSTKGLGDKRFTTFGSVTYSPKINGQTGEYAVLVYNQPSVDIQPENTVGWSVNLSQNLNEKWGVFMRANAVTGNVTATNQSYVVGGVLNNPLQRNSLDQIGLGVAYNKVNKDYFENASSLRNFETVVETYWNIGITQFITIAPDVQLYVHPASKKDRDFGTVFSLRATILL